MSGTVENQQSQNQTAGQAAPEKSGCMTWLGVLLLVAAVLTAAWCFIVKPALEEKGVDVDEKIEQFKDHSRQAIDKTQNTLKDAGESIAGKYDELKNTVGKIAESEKVEKIKDDINKIQDSETVSEIAGKTREVGEDIAEKAGEGGSWY